MAEKIILIDGHSILNRAFYGVPDLTNAEGLHTNAIYGFLNILFKVMEEEKAGYLAVAFDVKAPTFRHEMYQAYKGTRKPMPEELRQQVPVMKEVLKAMNILIMEQAGLEADDILGTMAKRAEKTGMEVSLVSGDRDLLQIASDHIKIRIPKTKMGRTEVEDYYAKDVEEKYQVNPIQFIELKALMGDAADNIPGVPKVGEKTATSLMTEYGSLENIYAHVDEISKKSIRESLIENKELADLSKALATIEINAKIPFTFSEAKINSLFNKEAYGWFKKLEFKNMLNRFEEPAENSLHKLKVHVITDGGKLQQLLNQCRDTKIVGLQVYSGENSGGAMGTESSGQFTLQLMEETSFMGMALSISDENGYWVETSETLKKEDLCKAVETLKASGVVATFGVKGLYSFMQEIREQESKKAVCNLFDTQLAAYIMNPLKNDYAIEDIANEHIGSMISSFTQLFGKADFLGAYKEKKEEFIRFACENAYVNRKAYDVLEGKLKDTGMSALFHEIEMPVSLVLYEMEQSGVQVQAEELKNYGDALMGRIQELQANIYEKAGEEFNINSPKQLGEILFGKMQLPGGKKTKSGYSTAADVLEKLSADYPIVTEILEYRGLTKLKSTYADGLSVYIEEDGRIHTNFNQTITATGRISSTEPNLQNIPMRTELGRLLRKVFVAKEGCVFTDADYSQIELRVLAHMSGDTQLIEAYNENQDIHRITASKVFHTPFDEVTDLQRRNAKAVNFGIVYGISSFGLSQDLSISRKEAAAYIEQYFKTYPGIKDFLDRTVQEAKDRGYVTTLFGRRRPVPELSSSNFMQRSFGERVAMNSPIQGTAADIIKIAMVRVRDRLLKEGLSSKLILQIHDELLIETYVEEEDKVKAILSEEMHEAADLKVSMDIDLHVGSNWYEAK